MISSSSWKTLLPLWASWFLHGGVHATPCKTQVLETAVPPAGTGVKLQSYYYCAGTLYTRAYIENINYDKVVTLYYSNGAGKATPMTAIALKYNGSVPHALWEYWTATTTSLQYDGIDKFLNITYEAIDVRMTYNQTLNLPVVASGNPPPKVTPPKPYASPKGLQPDITKWLQTTTGAQAVLARNRLFDNIQVNGSATGTVIAAQSYSNPDYAYNWVRDSSLTMDVVQSFYAAANAKSQSYYEDILFNYAIARATEQNDPDLRTGLGEPKFNLDNTVYTGPWGRPQNDGPATAAITLMEFANAYLAKGGSLNIVKQKIYDSNSNPSQAPVLKDLLYVASNWSSLSFDIWEEEEGDHFYDRLVQHRALVLGSKFATKLGDSGTASTLSREATAVAATLSQFWDPGRELILYEYGPVLNGKSSYKDTAVLLGVIHGYAGDNVYSYSNPQVLASAYQIVTCFLPVYKVAGTHKNSNGRWLGTPVGRYPEDVYNGTSTSGFGNPWYLCTSTVAEILYRAASELKSAGEIQVTAASVSFWTYFAPGYTYKAGQSFSSSSKQFSAMVDSLAGWGDAFLRTVQYYTPAGGHLSEEFDRTSGVAVGAKDLTWSYAALLTAAFARAQLADDTGYIARLANLPSP